MDSLQQPGPGGRGATGPVAEGRAGGLYGPINLGGAAQGHVGQGTFIRRVDHPDPFRAGGGYPATVEIEVAGGPGIEQVVQRGVQHGGVS